MTFSGSFSALWVIGGVIWAPRWRPKAHSKSFQKIIEFSVIFGPPRGSMPRPPPGSPGSKKRTFSAKVAISLQRGANFQFLDFGTPLEKSVSLTFSEQWLCHFSKGGFGGAFQQDDTEEENHTPVTCQRHGGGYIYIYIYRYKKNY